MQQSHSAWLKKNPHISSNTFQFLIDLGFDIHHIDHDHSNNDPKNLMLVWRNDHASLHSRIDSILYKELKKKLKKPKNRNRKKAQRKKKAPIKVARRKRSANNVTMKK